MTGFGEQGYNAALSSGILNITKNHPEVKLFLQQSHREYEISKKNEIIGHRTERIEALYNQYEGDIR